MSKGRMEAFSDGVLAIVITIMVLKLNAPESLTLDAVKEVCTSWAKQYPALSISKA